MKRYLSIKIPALIVGLILIWTPLVWGGESDVPQSREFNYSAGPELGKEINEDPARFDALFHLSPEFFAGVKSRNEHKTPRLRRPWLGIGMKSPEPPPVDPATGETFPAIEIATVFPLSAAENAGLLRGDVIVGSSEGRFGEQTGSPALGYFRKWIGKKNIGDSIVLKILRAGEAREVTADLGKRLTTRTVLKSHPELAGPRENESLLRTALEKGQLGWDYSNLLEEFRQKTREASSMLEKDDEYNHFRLSEINYVLSNPMDLPRVTAQLTRPLDEAFSDDSKDLAMLIAAGMEALDLPTETINVSPARDLSELAERVVVVIEQARKKRSRALATLSAGEINRLMKEGRELLKPSPEENGEPPKEKDLKKLEKSQREFFESALKMDFALLLSAGLDLARTLDVDALAGWAEDSPSLQRYPNDWYVYERDNLLTIETPAGKVLIGGEGDNVYTEDAALIIDLGGDDKYFNHAGGSTLAYPFQVAIDLTGNDLYSAPDDFSQGAGFLGAGFLIDVQGDDRYLAKDYSQGAGLFGVGVFVDMAGDDEYQAGSAVQGAAAFGVGLLAEGAGDDRYSAKRYAQGLGFVKGYGALVEAGGNDHYFAGGTFGDDREPGKAYQSLSQGFGYGYRPWDTPVGASGGVGILADAEGNDTYVADYFAQGASYWYALGILSDQSGDDNYVAGRYAQGAGIHFSAGVLLDRAGNDNYLADFGVAQGCGHDYGAGFLLDNGGNDRYVSGVIAQGAGNDNGIGVLADVAGDDEYFVKGMGQGRGNYAAARELGSFGLLFDTGGGADRYSPEGKDNSLTFQTKWGIHVDSR